MRFDHRKKKFVMVKDEKQLSKRAQRFGNQLNDAPKTKKANFTDLINQGVRMGLIFV